MNVGAKIKAARIAKNMTQEELGKILGVQKSAIAKYENGRVVNIKRSTLQKISEVLGIRPSELFFEQVQQTNDTITDAVVRMRTDAEFLSAVESLLALDQDKLSLVTQMISAFKK